MGTQKFNPFQPAGAYAADFFFENIEATEEIAHNQQLLLWPQCFQLLSIRSRLFKKVVYILGQIVSKVICCRSVIGGKGLEHSGCRKQDDV